MKRLSSLLLYTFPITTFLSCTNSKNTQYTRSKTQITLPNGKVKKAIKLTLETTIDTSTEEIWNQFSTYPFWIETMKPKVILKPSFQKTKIIPHTKDKFQLTIHHVIPFGKHYIHWKTVDSKTKTIVTNEYGGYVKVWNNTITITSIKDSKCILTDQLLLRGGVLTSPTATWAKSVLRNRHKRIAKHFKTK